MQLKKAETILIGRQEFVSFPELNMLNIKAKIDTGALTSSIHARKIKIRKTDSGESYLQCELLKSAVPADFYEYEIRSIRSSNGSAEFRYIVKLPVVLGNKTYEAEFSLANRSTMKFPILIGVTLLKQGFIVDVRKKYLLEKLK